MAQGSLAIVLCSPQHEPVRLEAAQLVVPGAAGIFTVLPGHTSLLSTLTHGVVIATLPEGEKRFFAVHGGFAEVLDDSIQVLADIMEEGSKVDEARAKAALDRAQSRIRKPEEGTDIGRAEAASARSLARLQASGQEEY